MGIKQIMLVVAVLVLVLSPMNAAATTTTCYPTAANYNTGSTDGTTLTRPSTIAGYNTEDGWAMFDTSAIPDTHTISSVEFHFYVNNTYYPYWSVTPVSSNPLTASPANLMVDINAEAIDGFYKYRNEVSTYAAGWKSFTLEGAATLDLRAELANDRFTVGIASRDNSATYFIVLDGWAETNPPYLVVEHSLVDFNPIVTDLGTMGCGDVLSHSGDTTGATNYCGNPSGDAFLMFEVLQDGLYTLDMCHYYGTLYDTYLRLYDDECCGNQIAFNDDDPNCGLKSRIDIVLSPGVYYAQVEGFDTIEGPYEIEITCDQPVDLGPVPCFEEIVYDQDTSGAINYCGYPAGDAHFKFTVDYTASYTISLCNAWTTYDSVLWLFDDYSCGNMIAGNEDYLGCDLTSQIVVILDPGDYYTLVEGYGYNEGPYELHIGCDPPGGDTELELVPDMECYEEDDTVYLAITLSNGNAMIVGGQFFLGYDNTALDFETITVGDPPFTNEIYNVVDEGTGTIDYAVGVPEGDPGTIYDTVMAYLTFTALSDICSEPGLVHFRTHSPPTRLSDNYGNAEYTVLLDLDIDDTTPPVISCPGPLTLECDQPTDPPGTGTATATDNCDAAPSVTHSDVIDFSGCGGYTGTITRTWLATDHCGNSSTCDQVITVVDTTVPVVTPGAIGTCYTTQATAEAAAITATTATDNCSAPGSLVYTAATVGDCSAVITVTVADACANSNSVTYNTTIDGTDPVISGCPGNISVNADAGLCTAVVSWTAPTATDNCTLASFTSSHNPGDTFPAGPTTVTYTAVDGCGNSATCTFTVTVDGNTQMVVDLSLSPTVSSPTTRCITFVLWDCTGPTSTIVNEVITFTGGTVIGHTMLVPCGNWTCVTARDKLHTLRRTLNPLPVVGTQFVADFATAGKDLIGGNLNDDQWIDILDFGVFSWQWGGVGGDTNCSTTWPHADINGDGNVNTLDFTFISNNFLGTHEPNCCGAPSPTGPADGPLLSISVAELQRLGLSELALGDLNGDAVLDQADMVAFMQGARPSLKPETKEGITPHE